MRTPDDRTHGSAERRAVVPPTAVRLLPLLLVAFGLSMLIDVATDWPMLLRWLVAGAGGVIAAVVCVRWWAARQR